MPLCWLFTGITLEEALEKASTAISVVNEKCQEIAGGNWVEYAQRLTNDPEIEGTQYYYMFQAPPTVFQNNAVYDLEAEFDVNWFVQEI